MWSDDGKPIEESVACLKRCLDWCGKYHLRAIVDLHILRAHNFNAVNEGGARNSLWTDPVAQSNFIRLWTELSARLRTYPVDQVAYELMNEPVAPDPEDWNKLVARALKSLRAVEPTRVVVIGANLWQTPSSFPHLEVPTGDQNIILSFHTYAPMFFTHHTANWAPFRTYTGPGTISRAACADQGLGRIRENKRQQCWCPRSHRGSAPGVRQGIARTGSATCHSARQGSQPPPVLWRIRLLAPGRSLPAAPVLRRSHFSL